MKPRYDVVEFKRQKHGFKAVIVDNQHPSGVSGVPIVWFKSVDDAVASCTKSGITFQVIKQK